VLAKFTLGLVKLVTSLPTSNLFIFSENVIFLEFVLFVDVCLASASILSFATGVTLICNFSLPLLRFFTSLLMMSFI
jgi:hypothetical protein